MAEPGPGPASLPSSLAPVGSDRPGGGRREPTGPRAGLFLLYQMGASEDYVWYSVVGVFLSEAALRADAEKRGLGAPMALLEPTAKNEVILTEPQEFVAVRSPEGDVPEVELVQPDRD